MQKSVDEVRKHPLMPKDINIEGFLMDPTTGEIKPVDEVVLEK